MKTKFQNQKTSIEFEINKNVAVTVAYPDNLQPDPMDSTWKLDDKSFSILKYLPKYEADLKAKKEVKSSMDVAMKLKNKNFNAGKIKIELTMEEPTYFLVIFAATIPPEPFNFSGGEVLVTRSK